LQKVDTILNEKVIKPFKDANRLESEKTVVKGEVQSNQSIAKKEIENLPKYLTEDCLYTTIVKSSKTSRGLDSLK